MAANGSRGREVGRPNPNGEATDAAGGAKSGSGATKVIAGRGPASARSARIASSAATPPPATTTRGVGGLVLMVRP